MCLRSEPCLQLRERSRAGLARRASALLVALAGHLTVLQPFAGHLFAAEAHADDVLEYLEARGLDALAVERLELLARNAETSERGPWLDRLAAQLARLLESTPEGAQLERLVTRAQQLTSSLSPATADGLRVSIARARYRGAAYAAESIRAGILADAQAAARTLSEQSTILLEVAERADKRASDLDRRLERADGVGRDLLEQAMNEELGVAGQARYLAAWSLLYRGALARSRADLERAERLFIDMLGGREGRLAPNEVSEDLRSDEAFASAILGLGLAKARLAGFGEAARWLELLELRTTNPSVREAVAGWKMVAALDALAFGAARSAFSSLAGREDVGNWARVAVARAVEDGAGDDEAGALLREALAQLASARELSVVRALVERYGDGILGDDAQGFVPRFIRGARIYDESQKLIDAAEGDDARLESDEVIGTARRAAEALNSALAAEDTERFTEAAMSCRLMLAWSLRVAQEPEQAAKLFEEVAAASVGRRAEEAARMGIACLDDARSKTRDVAVRARLDGEIVVRIDVFLSRFPSSDHVVDLLVRKVASQASPDSADIDELLQVARENPGWLASRKQAAAALYRIFRGGSQSRAETGKRYLAVLAELPVDPANGLPASSASIARQALEVVLAAEVRDVRVATSLLEALDRATTSGEFDRREADEELAYRRLQLAMYANRWANVEAALAPFEKPEATKIWADAALRLAVRGAEARRRAAEPDAPERGAYVATIVRGVDAILERDGGVEQALDPKSEGVAARIAFARIGLDARVELLMSTSDPEEGRKGLRIADTLLANAPRDATLLRGAAMCAESAGNLERAAEALRALVAGLAPRTTPWFDAKVDQLRVLSRLDPARARAVLSQYRSLYPDLGPPAVRERILEIAREIDRATPENAPDAPNSGGGGG
jgi:hypothetical protein